MLGPGSLSKGGKSSDAAEDFPALLFLGDGVMNGLGTDGGVGAAVDWEGGVGAAVDWEGGVGAAVDSDGEVGAAVRLRSSSSLLSESRCGSNNGSRGGLL